MGRTGRKRAGRAVMLVMQGKEEEKVHKSSDLIRHVTNIYESGGLEDMVYYQHSPRMLPDGVCPVMVMRDMRQQEVRQLY